MLLNFFAGRHCNHLGKHFEMKNNAWRAKWVRERIVGMHCMHLFCRHKICVTLAGSSFPNQTEDVGVLHPCWNKPTVGFPSNAQIYRKGVTRHSNSKFRSANRHDRGMTLSILHGMSSDTKPQLLWFWLHRQAQQLLPTPKHVSNLSWEKCKKRYKTPRETPRDRLGFTDRWAELRPFNLKKWHLWLRTAFSTDFLLFHPTTESRRQQHLARLILLLDIALALIYLYLGWPCRSPTGFLWFLNARCPIWIKPHTSMPFLWGTRAPCNRTGILDADGCESQQSKIWNARMTRTNRMTRMSRMNPPACRRVLWILLVRSCTVCFVFGLCLDFSLGADFCLV